MKVHLDVTGWIHLLAGVLFTGVGIFVSLALLFFGPWFYGTPGHWPDDAIAGLIILVMVSVAFFVVGIPSLIAGIGLRKHKRWARVLAIILAILALASFPIGTAAGIYTLWVLTHKETEPLLGAAA